MPKRMMIGVAVFFCCSMAMAINDRVPGFVKKTMCARSGIKREIQINYDNAVTQVGCEVLYQKRQEGAWRRKTLWRAQYEAGFCDQRVNELVTRLESWGWSCQQGDLR